MQYEDDIAFQRAILANPADTTLKLVYADWLQDRADPRADYVRAQVEGRALPEGEFDPAWVAFMTTLAQPFVPIRFQDDEPGHPFTEPVGCRGRIVAFESQYHTADSWSAGLLADLTFLMSVEWGMCFYGAMDGQIKGFLCDLPSARTVLNELNVLLLLKAADIDDERDTWLDTILIRTGFEFDYQFMFDHDDMTENDGAHGLLKRHVVDGRLWYVLLHIGGRPCDQVVLFTVGRSPHGNRLVGAITNQACHNLCD
jgi:uncharacterized protein (TIGR02996 family)